ncbi:MAG: plasmid recombination protein, partial [Clostridiales bacterium]|nr:plasmid recombination protein [Clostridiales bacterium]
MKRTISAMVVKVSTAHNNRDFIAENVDRERTKNNITYCNEDIKAVYHELFDDALEKYNAKQTRKDRVIDDYYEKIRTGKQEKLFHEFILQIGNKDNMGAATENGKLIKKILDKYMQGFQERNPNLRVFLVHIHMDEATLHLHIDFVPFTTGSKRGLETRVSLKKALEAQVFVGKGKSDTEWNR